MTRALAIFTVLFATLARGQAAGQPGRPDAGLPSDVVPAGLERVGFDQRLGVALPLDTAFVDEAGVERRLRSFFGEKPMVVAFVYYDCPMLCSLVLEGITTSLRALEFSVGSEFDVLVVSFDPREGPQLAASTKAHTVGHYGRPDSAGGWHFLTGGEAAIAALTDAAGFRYAWDDSRQQFAHPAGIVVTTPDGRIARYFYGIDFPPRDLRLGLVEASRSSIGTPVDQVLLYCFQYDPATGRYSVATLTAVRVGGVLTLMALGGFVVLMVRRERREPTSRKSEGRVP